MITLDDAEPCISIDAAYSACFVGAHIAVGAHGRESSLTHRHPSVTPHANFGSCLSSHYSAWICRSVSTLPLAVNAHFALQHAALAPVI